MSTTEENNGEETPKEQTNLGEKNEGINAWNDRLDENLEKENHNDVSADKKSKDFFEENEKLK